MNEDDKCKTHPRPFYINTDTQSHETETDLDYIESRFGDLSLDSVGFSFNGDIEEPFGGIGQDGLDMRVRDVDKENRVTKGRKRFRMKRKKYKRMLYEEDIENFKYRIKHDMIGSGAFRYVWCVVGFWF